MERRGIVADCCELNRQIKADNKLLLELKAQVQKLTKTVRGGINFIIENLENMRKNMIIFCYHLLHIRSGKDQIEKTLKAVQPDLGQYELIVRQIKSKSKERKLLLLEKKALSPLQVLRERELSQKIATITEDWEELQSEKAVLLNLFGSTDDIIKKCVAEMEANLEALGQQDENTVPSWSPPYPSLLD